MASDTIRRLALRLRDDDRVVDEIHRTVADYRRRLNRVHNARSHIARLPDAALYAILEDAARMHVDERVAIVAEYAPDWDPILLDRYRHARMVAYASVCNPWRVLVSRYLRTVVFVSATDRTLAGPLAGPGPIDAHADVCIDDQRCQQMRDHASRVRRLDVTCRDPHPNPRNVLAAVPFASLTRLRVMLTDSHTYSVDTFVNVLLASQHTLRHLATRGLQFTPLRELTSVAYPVHMPALTDAHFHGMTVDGRKSAMLMRGTHVRITRATGYTTTRIQVHELIDAPAIVSATLEHHAIATPRGRAIVAAVLRHGAESLTVTAHGVRRTYAYRVHGSTQTLTVERTPTHAISHAISHAITRVLYAASETPWTYRTCWCTIRAYGDRAFDDVEVDEVVLHTCGRGGCVTSYGDRRTWVHPAILARPPRIAISMLDVCDVGSPYVTDVLTCATMPRKITVTHCHVVADAIRAKIVTALATSKSVTVGVSRAICVHESCDYRLEMDRYGFNGT